MKKQVKVYLSGYLGEDVIITLTKMVFLPYQDLHDRLTGRIDSLYF